MKELMIFENEEFGKIRTVTIDNEPWFVGKDVGAALGYERNTKAIQDHVEDEDKDVIPIQDSIGRMQNTPIINESGLYALIFGSKLDSAKRFKRWVTSEVLPSLRKTGSYEMKNYSPEMKAILMHDEKIVKIDGRVADLENNMIIDYAQQQVLKNEVNKTVVTILGGKEAQAYKRIGKKVFSECNHDIQDRFSVNSRNNIPRMRFKEAVEYIKSWNPSVNTMLLIQENNLERSEV